LVGMLIAVGVNLVEFKSIDRTVGHSFRALAHYGNESLFEVAIRRNPRFQQMVAPFYYFGLVSPDATIILPTIGLKSWFELSLGMVSFGHAREIRREDYDPQASLNMLDLQPYKVDLGGYAPDWRNAPSDLNGRFSIFRQSPRAQTFVVFAPEGNPGREKPMLFIDINLLDDPMQKSLR